MAVAAFLPFAVNIGVVEDGSVFCHRHQVVGGQLPDTRRRLAQLHCARQHRHPHRILAGVEPQQHIAQRQAGVESVDARTVKAQFNAGLPLALRQHPAAVDVQVVFPGRQPHPAHLQPGAALPVFPVGQPVAAPVHRRRKARQPVTRRAGADRQAVAQQPATQTDLAFGQGEFGQAGKFIAPVQGGLVDAHLALTQQPVGQRRITIALGQINAIHQNGAPSVAADMNHRAGQRNPVEVRLQAPQRTERWGQLQPVKLLGGAGAGLGDRHPAHEQHQLAMPPAAAQRANADRLANAVRQLGGQLGLELGQARQQPELHRAGQQRQQQHNGQNQPSQHAGQPSRQRMAQAGESAGENVQNSRPLRI